MTRCGNCGKHEGSWYNNRNSDMFCSACVKDQNFLDLMKILRERVSVLIDEDIVNNAKTIQELRAIIKQGESIQS